MTEEKKNIFDNVGAYLFDFFDIVKGLDREGTIINIKTSNKIKGENAWLLISSIFIASLGLNLNSPAIIIGAMLISPLMGPILGLGLSMGINDGKLFLEALKNFAFAIIISLIVSTIFFYFTPFHQITDEILNRTKPTFLDAMVAFFGGIAGIVSFSRKESSNAIPGVAIATALMPPICVTGYGIANSNIDIVLNSFYLFFLNATIIAIATYLIIKFLNFPLRSHVDESGYGKIRIYITILTILILIPSTLILKKVIEEVNERSIVNTFIDKNFKEKQKVLGWEIIRADTTKNLVIDLLGDKIVKDSIYKYENKLKDMGLKNMSISFIQDSDIELKEINKLKIELKGQNKVYEELQAERHERELKEKQLSDLKIKIDSTTLPIHLFKDIKLEVKSLFANIEELGCTQGVITNFANTVDENEEIIFLLKWKAKIPLRTKKSDEKKLLNFLKTRLKKDNIRLIVY